MGTGRPSLVRAYGFVRILAGIRVLLITVASRMPIAFAVTDSQPSLRAGRAQAAPYFFEGPVWLSNSSLSGSASTSSGPRGLQGWLNGSQARSDQAIGFFGQAHDFCEALLDGISRCGQPEPFVLVVQPVKVFEKGTT